MQDQELFSKAIADAWFNRIDFSQLLQITAQLETNKSSHFAAVLYQVWLQRNPSPYAHAGYFNMALSMAAAGDLRAAETAYRKAIDIFPAFVQPRLNLGTLFERQGKIEQALAEWRWVADNVAPDNPENVELLVMALNHMGRVCESDKRLADASAALTRSLQVSPHQYEALHHWVHLRQKQCLWPVYAALPGVDEQEMRDSTSALAMLSVSDDPAAQLATAQRYVAKRVLKDVTALAEDKGYGHSRLRIAYLSSDFCLHPVSMLMAELFELHDRSRVEVYGYCWSPEDGSAMRQRVIASMDHFHRIHGLDDLAAAQLIRSHEIDVLIDLQGQTSGARPNILAHRPAPIQITYLGLPATTGLPSIDYVIADKFLIPEESAAFYSEKPLYMPDIYQVSDRKREIGPIPDRASCALPADAFVFCSLNNNFKFTPEIFDAWARILKRCPGSVLWLLSDNPWAETNLRIEAERRGIEAARLIFAPRLSPMHYMARYACADLFLDTFPFNAGTTANDALWMGLPILTLAGRTFASRMAGALLTAAQLPELISYSLQEYEDKAVGLASDPAACQRIRSQLGQVRKDGALFDTPLFARNLEDRLDALIKAL